jgi:gluconolactonase
MPVNLPLFILLLLTCILYAQNQVDLPASLAAPGAEIVIVKDGLQFCEGPAIDSAGNLYFSEFTAEHRIWKISPAGEDSVFRANSNGSNGLAFDAQGRLVSAETDRVTRTEHDGTVTVLAQTGDGLVLGNVNDVTLSAAGAMYFTNHSGGSVFYRDAEGLVSEYTGFNVPNGIEWKEESDLVYVCLSDEQKVFLYDAQADGSLTGGREFAALDRPDGITLDERGNVYVANIRQHEVAVFDSLGARLGAIAVDETSISNCAFGGPENRTLYMTGGSGVYKVELLVPGRRYPVAVSIISNKNVRHWRESPGLFLSRAAGRWGVHVIVNREAFSLNSRRITILQGGCYTKTPRHQDAKVCY